MIVRGNRGFFVSVTPIVHLVVKRNVIVYERLETVGDRNAFELLLRGVLRDGSDGPSRTVVGREDGRWRQYKPRGCIAAVFHAGVMIPDFLKVNG